MAEPHRYQLEDRTIGRILANKAATVGDRLFLTFGGNRWTYADAHTISNGYAEGFRRAGVSRGDHVALMLPNCPEMLWAIWGLGKLGAVAVPLNTAAKGEPLVYMLEQSDSVFLCASDAYTERVAPAVARVAALRQVLNQHDLASFTALSGPDPPEMAEVTYADPHLIMYTSGTTGPSKGVVCPQSQGHAVGLQLSSIFGYRPDDVLFTCLPLFHANALWYTVYAALWADASVALSPGFSASRIWDEIRSTNATVFNALGAMANIIWQLPGGPADRQHRVRMAMVVPTSIDLAERFRERYGIEVTSVFAMTENCAVTVLGPDDPPAKWSSAGRARDYMEVEIVDDRRIPVGPDEVGEICVRPRERGSVMLGYYKMPAATVAATGDLWFHTGDRGRLDADGYLYFIDRKKEAIRRRGENISAYEVETVLCRHPFVAEAAVVPVPSDLGEDDVMAYLVPSLGAELDLAEVIAFCADNMAYYMVPRYLEVTDALPKTPSEKIEKYRLTQRARDGIADLWDREKVGITVRRP
jgi:crotonobetaine/carnitine-CoA ligase